jgi:hypothetical protein
VLGDQTSFGRDGINENRARRIQGGSGVRFGDVTISAEISVANEKEGGRTNREKSECARNPAPLRRDCII